MGIFHFTRKGVVLGVHSGSAVPSYSVLKLLPEYPRMRDVAEGCLQPCMIDGLSV